jgi:hypothetical protein
VHINNEQHGESPPRNHAGSKQKVVVDREIDFWTIWIAIFLGGKTSLEISHPTEGVDGCRDGVDKRPVYIYTQFQVCRQGGSATTTTTITML